MEKNNVASMSKICIIQRSNISYPLKSTLFRPSTSYPEYVFEDVADDASNFVYEMIREGFIRLGLDYSHIGEKSWNPLGKYIKPGNYVLLKPNMVMDRHPYGAGTECLYTHPSIVAACIDYVWIALQGNGKIIVGDAPLQECNFEHLCQDSGYQDLIEYYKKNGVDIELVDFRNVKTTVRDGIHYSLQDGDDGTVVQLGKLSAFHSLTDQRLSNLRITNYDPHILARHHTKYTHEYKVANHLIKADCVISLPKPKTHRKAGITAALKNFVGINANKEYLPHHTIGAKCDGGDAYENRNIYLELANMVLDVKNTLEHEKNAPLAMQAYNLFGKLYSQGIKFTHEPYWEGSWYGNDTIWRTILDLNRIVLYADKSGQIRDTPQRRIFAIGDMIISGHKEGPLEPTPKYGGSIVLGEDLLAFDRVVCSMMGFDYLKIPSLAQHMEDEKYAIFKFKKIQIISNNSIWNEGGLDDIQKNSLQFQPSKGWEKILGKPEFGNEKDEGVYSRLKKCGKLYIYGAGHIGKMCVKELLQREIAVEGFCDRDVLLQGKEIMNGLKCTSIEESDENAGFIIAVPGSEVDEAKRLVLNNRRKIVGIAAVNNNK